MMRQRLVLHRALCRCYHARVIEHYENPRNVGKLNSKEKDVGTGLVGAPACGDVLKLQIKVVDDVIVDAKFKTFGCGSAISASSYTTEAIIGETVSDALSLTNKAIATHLDLPPVKLHCSMLAEDAVRAAVANWRAKSTQTPL